MSSRTIRRAAPGLLVAALLVAAIAAVVLGRGVQMDGDGVLASANDPAGFESMAVDPSKSAGPWTFGLRLCLAHGVTPAVITAVAPVESVGDGFRVIGILARDWTATADDPPVVSVDRYPMQTSARLGPAVGFAVAQPCTTDFSYPGRFTELDVGFDRVGTSGGGWEGIDVSYTVGGRPYTVRFNHNLLICGSAVADACAAGPSAARPTSP